MIVIGNPSLTLGLRFCGVRKSITPKGRDELLAFLGDIANHEIIIANASFVDEVPELKEYPNLVSIPDILDNFDNVDDLRYIVKTAIGVELEGI